MIPKYGDISDQARQPNQGLPARQNRQPRRHSYLHSNSGHDGALRPEEQ